MSETENPGTGVTGGKIHDEHPFATPDEQRDPVRQLRGRLAAPVTIITAGEGSQKTGLTVSSLVAAEGDPNLVYWLLGPDTDLHTAVEATGKFTVHVCEVEHRTLSDVFAGFRPVPGGQFAGLDYEESGYGPQLAGFDTLAKCSLRDMREESFSLLVSGRIDDVVVHDLEDPLTYFRGAYRHLES